MCARQGFFSRSTSFDWTSTYFSYLVGEPEVSSTTFTFCPFGQLVKRPGQEIFKWRGSIGNIEGALDNSHSSPNLVVDEFFSVVLVGVRFFGDCFFLSLDFPTHIALKNSVSLVFLHIVHPLLNIPSHASQHNSLSTLMMLAKDFFTHLPWSFLHIFHFVYFPGLNMSSHWKAHSSRFTTRGPPS